MNDDFKMSYIGRCPGCNAVVCATIDNPSHRKENAKHLAKWIRDGLIVERVESDAVRELWGSCTCKKNKPKSAQLSLFDEAAQ